MKITASKLFDTDLVVKTLEAAKVTGLTEFVTNLSDISDQLIRAMKKRLSVADNIDCSEKVVELVSGTALTLANPIENRAVRHMIATRVTDTKNPLLSLVWAYKGTGELTVTATFQTTTKNSVTLLMLY